MLKINLINSKDKKFKLNKKIVFKYFDKEVNKNAVNYDILEVYFDDFFKFCFELSLDNMIQNAKNYKISYGST